MASEEVINEMQKKAEILIEELRTTIVETQEKEFIPGIETLEQYKKRINQEVLSQADKFQFKCVRALEVILAELINMDRITKENEDLQELLKGLENFNKITNNPNWIEEIKDPYFTLQKLIGCSDKLMERFYNIGIHCLTGAHYEDAACVFTLLSILNPYNANIWLCLGISLQECFEWQQAIHVLNHAQEMDPTNPIAYLQEARCYLGLQDRTNALQAYEKVIKNSADNAVYSEVKEYALVQKKELERVIK